MKIFFILLFCFSSLFAQYCYKDKSSNEIVCYERYFDRDNIYKSKKDELYFTSSNGEIYEIDDKIEIKFNSIGAVISLEKDFEITFVDKLNKETYIFQVKNRNELFGILSNLNQLDAIAKAVPSRDKRYTQSQMQRVIAARKERLKRVQEKLSEQPQSNQDIGFGTGFNQIETKKKEPMNFLKGGK